MSEYEAYKAITEATECAEAAEFTVSWGPHGWAVVKDGRSWVGDTAAELDCFLEGYKSAPAGSTPTPDLVDDDVQWVVNDIGELGVKIGDRFFWLYKGDSLVYNNGKHDDGTPMKWRLVGKREFGEVCHPVDYYDKGHSKNDRYTEPSFTPWQDLPVMPAYTNGYERNHKGATRPEPKS